MEEKIRLTPIPKTHKNPKTGEDIIKREREIELVGFTDIPNSAGYEAKNLSKIKMGEKEKSLVRRRIGSGNIPDYLNIWQAFKSAGLPVVKHMWRSGDHHIFMKNLKHDGSEIFGKGYAYLTWHRDPAPLSEMERKFIKVMEEDESKIKSSLNDMVKNADANGLILPWDDPFELLLHPDGTWDIVVLDLTKAELKGDTSKNKRYVEKFFLLLKSLKEALVFGDKL